MSTIATTVSEDKGGVGAAATAVEIADGAPDYAGLAGDECACRGGGEVGGLGVRGRGGEGRCESEEGGGELYHLDCFAVVVEMKNGSRLMLREAETGRVILYTRFYSALVYACMLTSQEDSGVRHYGEPYYVSSSSSHTLCRLSPTVLTFAASLSLQTNARITLR
jgi:hypothetical protein